MRIQTSEKEPEVTQEAVEDINNSTELTDAERSQIGENLVGFCGEYDIVLGTTELELQQEGIPDGEVEEVNENHRVADKNATQGKHKHELHNLLGRTCNIPLHDDNTNHLQIIFINELIFIGLYS